MITMLIDRCVSITFWMLTTPVGETVFWSINAALMVLLAGYLLHDITADD